MTDMTDIVRIVFLPGPNCYPEVTVHSRNAHKLRIYDPTKWIMRAFAPRRRRLGMRKCRYYEQLEAVNSNTRSETFLPNPLTITRKIYYKI